VPPPTPRPGAPLSRGDFLAAAWFPSGEGWRGATGCGGFANTPLPLRLLEGGKIRGRQEQGRRRLREDLAVGLGGVTGLDPVGIGAEGVELGLAGVHLHLDRSGGEGSERHKQQGTVRDNFRDFIGEGSVQLSAISSKRRGEGSLNRRERGVRAGCGAESRDRKVIYAWPSPKVASAESGRSRRASPQAAASGHDPIAAAAGAQCRARRPQRPHSRG
jgi:hypothetical protein